jgi:hypothetical protein
MGATPLPDVPVLQDEVNRKCYDTLHGLVARLESGKITEAQFGIAVEVLFEALSGLVSDKDFFYFIGELRKKAPLRVREPAIFIAGKKVVVAMRELGGDEVTVIQCDVTGYKRFDMSEEYRPDTAAFQKMQEVGKRMTDLGFKKAA